MKITIEEISKALKNVFSDAEILSTDNVYEKIENSENLKLVIFLNKLFDGDISILYTKLIFVVDKEKTYLAQNSFSYLYDINCEYHTREFEDIEEFKKKVSNIFDNKIFGDNTLVLSKFIESPAVLINTWFEDNKIDDISIFNVKYGPKVHIMPCKSLFFSFDININNTNNIELIIKKEKDGLFYLNFKIHDKTVTIERNNLSTLIETIGDTIKNNI